VPLLRNLVRQAHHYKALIPAPSATAELLGHLVCLSGAAKSRDLTAEIPKPQAEGGV
jgi:hypothetical protein